MRGVGGPSKLGNAWKSEQLGVDRRAGAAAGKGAAVRALGTWRDGTAVQRPGAHGGSGAEEAGAEAASRSLSFTFSAARFMRGRADRGKGRLPGL